ncbi:MAG: hypothetical protein J6T13_10875 [Bacteroidales bacterium]|nr:hypothetical protein [Bacteroidales bacterium]MBO7648506.1 hypothetical protein [Bacteroidales bacterium]MCR4857961.1 hypothetical protein [Bacteroidales bacterium]
MDTLQDKENRLSLLKNIITDLERAGSGVDCRLRSLVRKMEQELALLKRKC